MAKKISDIKDSMAEIVVRTVSVSRGKKSPGTKISSVKRTINTTVIAPFSK